MRRIRARTCEFAKPSRFQDQANSCARSCECWVAGVGGACGYRRVAPYLKKERAEVLFQAVEKAIPDVRSRIEVEMIGTPLTCARFLRRNRGTYGGRGWIKDGQDGVVNLEVNTPLDGLLCVGDSRFPGPGVPAVAAGGMVAAHSLVGALEQAKTIDRVCK